MKHCGMNRFTMYIRRICAVAVVLALILTEGSISSYAADKELRDDAQIYSAEEIYERFSRNMVEIKTWDSEDNIYVGTGFFISKNLVLTNYHVISSACSMAIYDYNNTSYTISSVYAYDDDVDLALIKINRNRDSYFEFEDDAHAGEEAYCIGSPAGLTASFIDGIVSRSRITLDGVDYVQVSMPSGTGLGGGPIINKYGKVLGVLTLTVTSAQNITFAIDSKTCQKFISESDGSNSLSVREFYKENEGKIKESNYFEISDVYDWSYASNVREEGELSSEEICAKAYDAMVDIIGMKYVDSPNMYTWTGSGFFVGENTIITNAHVVSGAEILYIEDYYGNLYDTSSVILTGLYGADLAMVYVRQVDEIILSIEENEIPSGAGTENSSAEKSDQTGDDHPEENDQNAGEQPTSVKKHHGSLKVNTDYVPAVGERIYTMGSPVGYSQTFAKGRVAMTMRRIEGYEYINTTAPLTGGSSGGVLLNRYGEVIGVVTLMVLRAENSNFAVSARYLKDVVRLFV